MKDIKGEKYIYLLMGYQLAKQNGGSYQVGTDNGYVGGQNYYRSFTIAEHDGDTLLKKKKNGSNFADFSKTYRVITSDNINNTRFTEYEIAGDNYSKNWLH